MGRRRSICTDAGPFDRISGMQKCRRLAQRVGGTPADGDDHRRVRYFCSNSRSAHWNSAAALSDAPSG
jgi:hypothetical protein